MTDSIVNINQKGSKLFEIFKNDIDIVLKLQEFLLSDMSSNMTFDEMHSLYTMYGELYHGYASIRPEVN